MSAHGRSRRRGRGQTLTEFALILPVFLIMTVAVVDGARVYMAQIALTNGVREATLFAVRGNYNAWCRNPADAGDPLVPIAVSCPSGASASNYSSDPDNLAFRVAVELDGMNPSRVVLDPPKCGTGTGAPSSSCAAVTSPTYVSVHATYTFDFLTPGITSLWGNSVTLQATSTGAVQ